MVWTDCEVRMVHPFAASTYRTLMVALTGSGSPTPTSVFAFIKATQSSRFRDLTFEENWARSKEAKVLRGAYHTFSFCIPPEEQFDALARVVPADPSMLPIAVDAELFPGQENSNVGGQSEEADCVKSMGFGAVRASVKKFADLIKQKYGLNPILYGNDYVLDEVLTTELTSHFPLWRVRYGLSNPPPPPWAIWQYTINGKNSGRKQRSGHQRRKRHSDAQFSQIKDDAFEQLERNVIWMLGANEVSPGKNRALSAHQHDSAISGCSTQ